MKKRIENKYASLNPTQNGCVAYAAYANAIEKRHMKEAPFFRKRIAPLCRD